MLKINDLPSRNANPLTNFVFTRIVSNVSFHLVIFVLQLNPTEYKKFLGNGRMRFVLRGYSRLLYQLLRPCFTLYCKRAELWKSVSFL